VGDLVKTDAMIDAAFWRGRRVFLTGHTGFKGSWLCLWLHRLGAEVTGYALEPPTQPSLFDVAGIGELVHSIHGDVRDAAVLRRALDEARPEIVIHMAAQPLVRDSYLEPVLTYGTNVMGTVHLLEACRHSDTVRAIVNVTSDKCYENREWVWGYREHEPMGGYDPYSSSKGCAELVTAAYRNSYFNPERYRDHGVALASARAGNVIGGGDWARDRLISDCVRALLAGEPIVIRNPACIRPWQHVLEPLSGYLLLAQKLVTGGARYAEGWNFGPEESDARPVEWLVQTLCRRWGHDASYVVDAGEHPHEARYLKLDCSKARALLGWRPRWRLARTLDTIVDWTRAYQQGRPMRSICLDQIASYQHDGTDEHGTE